MKNSDYFGVLEALLFASGEPVSTDRLCETLAMDPKQLDDIMTDLMGEYDDKRGLCILRLEDSYQLCTKKAHAPLIQAMLEKKKNTPLSNAAMEVLAIIAYNQPVTKNFIERVRGVDSGSTVNALVDRGLLEEAGRLDLPGRPIAYQTTSIFLRSFGLESLTQLPLLPSEEETQTVLPLADTLPTDQEGAS